MHRTARKSVRNSLVATAVVAAGIALPGAPAAAADTPFPTSVTIAGSLQSELGCAGDWQPDCEATHLAYDAADGVWQRGFDVPAGSWEYKAALNNSLDENYGVNATRNGASIALALTDPTSVKFYYDHETHWVADSVTSAIAVAPGSFQSELGCAGDWQPDCLRSWLQDPDGDGTYRMSTTAIPGGAYEFKVALNETWDVNYGQGGVSGGPNVAFEVPDGGATVTFEWDAATKVPAVHVTAAQDVVPPTVGAELVTVLSGAKRGVFRVVATCSDDVTEQCVVEADINDVPVEDDDVVWLVVHPGPQSVQSVLGTGVIRIKAPRFTLTVTCTDEAGNTTTRAVTPQFRTPG
jgi:hypothetical protein